MSTHSPTAGLADISVVAVDIFGTTVDWRNGVAEQVAQVAARRGAKVSPGRFTDEWRDCYLPALEEISRGTQPWRNLDTLHREALDDLLDVYGVEDHSTEKSYAGS